jgi:hypothetical protein
MNAYQNSLISFISCGAAFNTLQAIYSRMCRYHLFLFLFYLVGPLLTNFNVLKEANSFFLTPLRSVCPNSATNINILGSYSPISVKLGKHTMPSWHPWPRYHYYWGGWDGWVMYQTREWVEIHTEFQTEGQKEDTDCLRGWKLLCLRIILPISGEVVRTLGRRCEAFVQRRIYQ